MMDSRLRVQQTSQYELVSCPYDVHHKVRADRLKTHLIKCQVQSASKLSICPYNATHRFPEKQRLAHISACPNKSLLDHQLYEEETRSRIHSTTDYESDEDDLRTNDDCADETIHLQRGHMNQPSAVRQKGRLKVIRPKFRNDGKSCDANYDEQSDFNNVISDANDEQSDFNDAITSASDVMNSNCDELNEDILERMNFKEEEIGERLHLTSRNSIPVLDDDSSTPPIRGKRIVLRKPKERTVMMAAGMSVAVPKPPKKPLRRPKQSTSIL